MKLYKGCMDIGGFKESKSRSSVSTCTLRSKMYSSCKFKCYQESFWFLGPTFLFIFTEMNERKQRKREREREGRRERENDKLHETLMHSKFYDGKFITRMFLWTIQILDVTIILIPVINRMSFPLSCPTLLKGVLGIRNWH